MAISFNADEIFQLGEEIEKNGEAFYMAAVELAENEDIKNIFDHLAGQERNHLKIFQELRTSLPDSAGVPTVFDPDDELGDYLKALADSNVFTKKNASAKVLKGMKTGLEALQFALAFEKDTILLFTEMQDLTKQEWGADQINKLIDEERQHVRKIALAIHDIQ